MTQQARKNGYRGPAVSEPAPNEAPPENGLVSIYLSPQRQSSVIHWLNPNPNLTLLCMPHLPIGRVVARPTAETATCGRCINIKNARANRG